MSNLKKTDFYTIKTVKKGTATGQDCKNRHELNRIIREAKEDGCTEILIIIRFNY